MGPDGRPQTVDEVVRALGREVGLDLPAVRVTGDERALPSAFRIGTAAAAVVGAVTGAVSLYRREQGHAEVTVDVGEAVAAFKDERYFTIDGEALDLWAPLSRDYPTSDGWVRLHCNFDHHRDAALRALNLPPDSGEAQVAAACAGRTAVDVEQAVTDAGGCAAATRSRERWHDHPQSRAVARLPLIGLRRLGPAAHAAPGPPEHAPVTGTRPLDGVRVLDLTRVLAGPVATRVLAAHGAKVLKVGAAHLPEVPGVVISTAFGKRYCELDLRTQEGADALRRLVAGADVLVQSYRPGALAALGFGADQLASMRPGLVRVDISAYGTLGPWAGRRGFDSLVQMVCGIAHEGGDGGDGGKPVPLPVQALDHATGWLAALGAVAGLLRRRAEGGAWQAETILARTALWLDGLGRITPSPRGRDAGPEAPVPLERMDSSFGTLAYVPAPGAIGGARPFWSSPPPRRGEHPPAWW
ncbi:CoA transferase [Sphaerisporangium sp. TRM90804]|uniref:CoA transferase n=1 Tax=Sphaerisporangium sp. TRM90804 TaxID=3031113 RepID=UPI0024489EFE|nr:CoA transferase [Sphaerisporangium sp. TRM90804]MDH2430105.1 CoA transferase [Sphaerisporangium sp. TRM90804]